MSAAGTATAKASTHNSADRRQWSWCGSPRPTPQLNSPLEVEGPAPVVHKAADAKALRSPRLSPLAMTVAVAVAVLLAAAAAMFMAVVVAVFMAVGVVVAVVMVVLAGAAAAVVVHVVVVLVGVVRAVRFAAAGYMIHLLRRQGGMVSTRQAQGQQ